MEWSVHRLPHTPVRSRPRPSHHRHPAPAPRPSPPPYPVQALPPSTLPPQLPPGQYLSLKDYLPPTLSISSKHSPAQAHFRPRTLSRPSTLLPPAHPLPFKLIHPSCLSTKHNPNHTLSLTTELRTRNSCRSSRGTNWRDVRGLYTLRREYAVRVEHALTRGGEYVSRGCTCEWGVPSEVGGL